MEMDQKENLLTHNNIPKQKSEISRNQISQHHEHETKDPRLKKK